MRRLITFVLLLSLLVSCNILGDEPAGPLATPAPEPSPQSTDGPVTISFAAWDYERAIYEPLAQKFTAENPNIKVVIVSLDELTNITSDQPDFQSPTVMLRRIVSGADTAPANFLTPDQFTANLIMDLGPLMDADPNFKRDDFYPGAIDRYRANGGVWGLPRYIYAQILAYNKDLFTRAGVPEPKPGWTWADLLGAAEQIAQKNGNTIDTFGFFDPSSGLLGLLADLRSQGIDIYAVPSKDVHLDRPEVAAAIERFRDLTKKGALLQYGFFEGTEASDDPRQLIREGRVGIWMDEMLEPSYGPDGSEQPQSLDFAVGKAPFPANTPGFFSGVEGYMISAGTAHPTEAWRWIEFLSRQPTEQPGFRDSIVQSGRIPARQSLADAMGFWNNIEPEAAAAYKWQIEHLVADAQPLTDYIALSALSEALRRAITEPKDLNEILAEAQQQIERQVAEIQLTPTPAPDTSPVVVATPEPQEAPAGAAAFTFSNVGYNPPELRRLVRAFREQHPEYWVQIAATDTFTEPPTLESIARTNDCFTWWSGPQSDADFAALLDLQPLFDADATFPQSDYPAALLEPYRRTGGLFGLPYAVTLRTLNYNRTAFDAIGLKLPTAAWTPADFLAAAQSLTKGEGDKKQYGYVPVNGTQQDLLFFIGQFGGRITTGGGDDLRPNFTDPQVAEAIQWYIDLAKVHKATPPLIFPHKRDDVDGPGGEDAFQLVQAGRAGMWFDQGYGIVSPASNEPPPDGAIATAEPVYVDGSGAPIGPGGSSGLSFEPGIAPLPIGAGGLRSSDFYARSLFISARSQQAQGCWEWLKFLSGDVSLLQGDIPARTSVAESDAFAKQSPPDRVTIYKAYGDALKRSGQPGDNAGDLYGRMDLYWFYAAITAAIEKDADLKQELAKAQETTSAFMECLVKSGTPGKPATCASQVDPAYQGYNTQDPDPSSEGPKG